MPWNHFETFRCTASFCAPCNHEQKHPLHKVSSPLTSRYLPNRMLCSLSWSQCSETCKGIGDLQRRWFCSTAVREECEFIRLRRALQCVFLVFQLRHEAAEVCNLHGCSIWMFGQLKCDETTIQSHYVRSSTQHQYTHQCGYTCGHNKLHVREHQANFISTCSIRWHLLQICIRGTQVSVVLAMPAAFEPIAVQHFGKQPGTRLTLSTYFVVLPVQAGPRSVLLPVRVVFLEVVLFNSFRQPWKSTEMKTHCQQCFGVRAAAITQCTDLVWMVLLGYILSDHTSLPLTPLYTYAARLRHLPWLHWVEGSTTHWLKHPLHCSLTNPEP